MIVCVGAAARAASACQDNRDALAKAFDVRSILKRGSEPRTMVGSIERDGERIAHLDCVRSLQDAGSTNEATRKRARRHGTRHRVRTPASRARRAALTALCSLAVALLGIAGDRNAPSGARADVVFQRPFEETSVSADVLIPRAERNQGWYGGRIALTGFYSPQDEPVFIILGLRRPSGDWPGLSLR